MGGKALLFVILGLSTTLIWVTFNYGKLANLASLNTAEYIEYTTTQNAAISGANMAMNEIYRNPTWTAGYDDKPFEGCLIDVTVQILDTVRNIRRINSIATRVANSVYGDQTITKTVQVTLQPSKFSKFAYYSQSEGGNIYWTTGDTVTGPFHSQDDLRVNGTPVFNGSVTIGGELIKRNARTDRPEFNSSFETGVNLPLNEEAISTLNSDAQTAGFKFPPTFTYQDKRGNTIIDNVDTVYLFFDGDYIKYKYRYQDTWTSSSASSFSNNGVIFVDNAVLRIKGTVKGQFTVACSGSGHSGNGDIYIDDDLVYFSNPVENPSSTDILGLVSENDVIVAENGPNRDDIIINASIYCQNGGFGAQNHNDRGVSGTIYLLGGIIQNIRGAVGIIGLNGITSGYGKNYKYDERFMFKSPPKYPNTGSYEILSWYE